MNNKLLFPVIFLVIILFTAPPGSLLAEEGLEITEILILGPTRTEKAVIEKQLPFTIGDHWQKHYERWTINRLQELESLAYTPMRVIVKPLTKEECQVVVRVGEAELLYRDPAEYVIMNSLTLLFNRQVIQGFYSPLGYGEKLVLSLSPGDYYRYQLAGSTPLGAGMIELSLASFKQKRGFIAGEGYLNQGESITLEHKYWWNQNWRQTTGLSYHQTALNNKKQELIIPLLELHYRQLPLLGSWQVEAGLPQKEGNGFWKTEGTLFTQKGPLIGLLRGGYSSEDTPPNHRFTAGSFGTLPLRGEGEYRLAAAYGLGTLEYHFSLPAPFTPLIFLDGGLVWDEKANSSEILCLGIGAAIDTPLGMPMRFDLGTSTDLEGPFFNFSFGHSFHPPY